MTERVLVTGAGGFIGSRLVKRLLQLGYRVRVLLRDRIKGAHFRSLGCEVVTGDMVLFESFDVATRDCNLVFHLAVGGTDPETTWRINVDGTRELLRSAHENGARRFIHTSSIAVLGDDLPTEADGPGSEMWTMIPFHECRREKIVLIDGAPGIANLVYVDDLVEAFLLAARTRGIAGEIFHINGAERVTWKEYIAGLCRINRKPAPPSMSLKRARTYAFTSRWYTKLTERPARYYANLSNASFHTNKTYFTISKAEKVLGFVPGYNLERALVEIENWLRDQGYLPEH